MPFTEEERRERKRARQNADYERKKNDPEFRRKEQERGKEYRERKKQDAEWRARMNAHHRAWRERNKEQQREREQEQYRTKRATPEGIKSHRIKNWKCMGIICDDWDELYISYMAHEHCMECGCEFGEKGDGTGTFKCLDHNHLTGEIRGILCSLCNIRRGP